MNLLPLVSQARMAGVTLAAIVLPMASSAVQAGMPMQEASVDSPAIVVTQVKRDVVRVAVPYGDLNLANERGLATLNARIRSAVDKVCGDPDARELARSAATRECRDAASADAMAQVALLSAPRPLAAR